MIRPPTPAVCPVTSPRSSSSPDRRRAANQRSRSNWPTYAAARSSTPTACRSIAIFGYWRRGPTTRRKREYRTGSTAFSTPASAGLQRYGGHSRSTRSPRRQAPAACPFWSAAPGSTCGRSRRDWRRFRIFRRRSGNRQSSFIGRWAALRFASSWPGSTRQPRSGCSQETNSGSIRAFEVVRATGVTIGTWQQQTKSEPAYRFGTILLAPPREGLYERVQCPAHSDVRSRGSRRGEGARRTSSRPQPSRYEGGGCSRIPVSPPGRYPARCCDSCCAARHPAIRQTPNDLVPLSNDSGPRPRRAIFGKFAAPLASFY